MQVRSIVTKPFEQPFQLFYDNGYGVIDFSFKEPIEQCDWCQSEERNARHGNSSKKSGAEHDSGTLVITKRSEYSGDHKIKQHDREENSTTSSDQKGKNPSGIPSPRPTTRRYKLLKDVMC
ncbi:hypothetical protein POTOM_046368 [Populus tomentosa]|uniref:Uncharacterized protein n=1 Tax=Populus tomentosa TaxID=118781 RepID=A0A8X7YEA2_POPTO|nr:hypothetical protein POTOM_046368 [Populus tomentosa]